MSSKRHKILDKIWTKYSRTLVTIHSERLSAPYRLMKRDAFMRAVREYERKMQEAENINS